MTQVPNASPAHAYLSTYCWHENHDNCRRYCKTCQSPCRCGCHEGPGATPESPPTPKQTGDATALEMVEGALYRNPPGAELRLVVPAYCYGDVRARFETLAPGLWIAEFGADYLATHWLVTAEGMAAAGYTRVIEEPTA